MSIHVYAALQGDQEEHRPLCAASMQWCGPAKHPDSGAAPFL